jgi:hypothetical protein
MAPSPTSSGSWIPIPQQGQNRRTPWSSTRMRHAQRLDDLEVYDLKRILKLFTLLLQTLDGGRGHLAKRTLWGPHGLTKKHKPDSDSCRRNDMPRCTRPVPATNASLDLPFLYGGFMDDKWKTMEDLRYLRWIYGRLPHAILRFSLRVATANLVQVRRVHVWESNPDGAQCL